MRLLIFTLFSLSFSFTFAQKGDSLVLPRAVIKLAPLQFFSSTLELGIEAFNPTFSKSFNINVGLRSGAIDYTDGNGVNVEFAYRKYASPMKYHTRKTRQFYQGIYYSIFIQGQYFKGTEEDYFYNPGTGSSYNSFEQKIFSVSPGFTLGLQKTLWEILFLDVYVGGGIKYSQIDYVNVPDYETDYTILEPGYEGIYPKIGAKIGVGL